MSRNPRRMLVCHALRLLRGVNSVEGGDVVLYERLEIDCARRLPYPDVPTKELVGRDRFHNAIENLCVADDLNIRAPRDFLIEQQHQRMLGNLLEIGWQRSGTD